MYRPLYGDDVANSIELGDEMEFPKPTEVLGRIAAQTAKQVIFQKVREAERENIFAEYNQRIGEVVNGTVKRFENGDIILEIGRIEAVLPRKEQSRAESYTPGDRVRTVIKGVNRSAKGPQIVLSRTDPALLIKLFEQEVPEIYDGTVMIRGAVREAGDRAKVAVFSRERDVDPVGACVGMKGTRVQSIIRELRGEKIDIVEWSEDPIAFVTNALSPAKVQRVSIVDDRERVMEVVVEDKQLSLAIGKKGQNVRLAAKLTGWRIDIKSEEEKRREVEAQFEGLETAAEAADAEAGGRRRDGRGADGGRRRRGRRRSRRAAAVHARRHRREDRAQARRRRASRRSRRWPRATAEQLSEIPGIGGKTAEKILAAARGDARGEKARTVGPLNASRRSHYTDEEVTVGNCPDLQGRGTARHHEPGSDGAAQARSRHRGEERVEHDRRGRRAPVRRAPRAAAQHLAAERRHLRRDAGRQGQEGRAREEGGRAGQAGGARAAAAAPREDGEAGAPPPAEPSRRGAEPTSKPVAAAEPPPAEAPPRRGRRSARGRRAKPVAPPPAVDAPPTPRRRRRRAAEPAPPKRPRRGRRAAAPARAEARGARPHRAADAAAAHRRTASDDADAAAADDAGAARGAASVAPPRRTSGGPRRASGGRRARRATGPARRPPGRHAARPGGAPAAAPAVSGLAPQTPMGGPRPLPSQPVRPQQPGMPPRPGPVSAAARACRRVRRISAPRRRRASAPRVSAASTRVRRRRRCRRRRRRSRARSRSPKA